MSSYIGRSPNYGNAVVDHFVGNGGATYTLNYDTNTDGVVVSLDGVVQKNGTDFNITGTSLVFTSVVASPIEIQVVYTGLTLSFPTPSDGSVDSSAIVAGAVDDSHISGLAASKLTGTVAVANGGTGAATHTANNVLIGNGTSAITSVAPSTSGNVLTSNGSAWASTAPAGGGAWTLIGTASASTSATLDITGLDDTYDEYAIVGANLIPATDGSGLWLRMGDSGGIDSGASDYSWGRQHLDIGTTYSNSTTGVLATSDNSDSKIQLASNVGNAAGEGAGFTLFLSRHSADTSFPMFSGSISVVNSIAELTVSTLGGARLSGITLDRIQILQSTSNITSGRLTVYGIAHA